MGRRQGKWPSSRIYSLLAKITNRKNHTLPFLRHPFAQKKGNPPCTSLSPAKLPPFILPAICLFLKSVAFNLYFSLNAKTRVGKVLGTKVLGVRFRRIIPPRLNYVAGLQGEKPPLTYIKHTILPSPCRPTYSASGGLANKDSVVSVCGRALFYLSFFHAIRDQNCCDYMTLY